jgi:hypothetical protein
MKNNLKFVGFLILNILFFYFVPPFLIQLSPEFYSIVIVIVGTLILLPISIGMVVGYYRELNLDLFDERKNS